jgi:glycosyltransferase involved in cell wall biosynthesis
MKVIASVPTYNSETTIEETLYSLIKQSHPFHEIRVYDNHSSDKTVEIVSQMMKVCPILKLIMNEVNVGAEGNFTRCISEAEGDLIVIAHADDVYHLDFNKNVVAEFLKNDQVVASFCAANEIDQAGKVIGKRFIPHEIDLESSSYLNKVQAMELFYKFGNFITCPSVVVRSSIMREKIKTWNGTTFKTSADLDVWIRLLDYGDMVFINKNLINYRVAEASYSYRIAKRRMTKHDIFLVLESDENKVFGHKFRTYLNFLLNKDYANCFLNTLRTKDQKQISVFNWNTDFNFFHLVKVGTSSFWHLKMLFAILGLRAMYLLKRLL